MKKHSGITLIALVITIIVLLILAAVSIAMLTGDNGILTKTQEAQEKTTEAEAEEALKLALNEILANKMNPDYTNAVDEPDESVITADNIQRLVPGNNPNVNATATENTTDTKYLDVTLKIGNDSYIRYVNTETGEITTTAPSE